MYFIAGAHQSSLDIFLGVHVEGDVFVVVVWFFFKMHRVLEDFLQALE